MPEQLATPLKPSSYGTWIMTYRPGECFYSVSSVELYADFSSNNRHSISLYYIEH